MFSGMRSENPALSNWIKEVLKGGRAAYTKMMTASRNNTPATLLNS